jgi:MarR family transcriptional regulator, transcriptional regulator for hemolysin
MKDTPTGYALHGRLGYKVSRLARLMQGRLERGLAPLGLTRLMWCVLTGIGDESVDTPSELATYLGITRPATSRLLRELEGKGLLRRDGHEEDGRGRRLALTPHGHGVVEAARWAVADTRAHFATKLAQGELDAMLDMFDRLAAGEDAALTRL